MNTAESSVVKIMLSGSRFGEEKPMKPKTVFPRKRKLSILLGDGLDVHDACGGTASNAHG
jgi:hypothetical protein